MTPANTAPGPPDDAGDDSTVDWPAVERDPAYRRLRVMERRYVVPAAVVCLGFYLTFLVVAVTTPGALTARLFGGFNLAYALMLTVFVLVWAAVIGYVLLANRRWDAQVARVVEKASVTGREPAGDIPGESSAPEPDASAQERPGTSSP